MVRCGVGWTYVMLAPVIGIVQVSGAALADRYTYLSLIGFSVLIFIKLREHLKRPSGWRWSAAHPEHVRHASSGSRATSAGCRWWSLCPLMAGQVRTAGIRAERES